MKIFTYYEDINFNLQNDLLELWKTSWRNKGFDPVVLTEKNAKQSEFYNEFVDSLQKIHKKISGNCISNYGLSCYVRWLAYSTIDLENESVLVSDYDVIPSSLKPEDIRESVETLSFLNRYCPCLAYGTKKQFLNFCEDILSYSKKYEDDAIKKYINNKYVHYHDQEFLVIHSGVLPYNICSARSYIDGTCENINNHTDVSAFHISHSFINEYQQKYPENCTDLTMDQVRIKVMHEIVNKTKITTIVFAEGNVLESVNRHLPTWKRNTDRLIIVSPTNDPCIIEGIDCITHNYSKHHEMSAINRQLFAMKMALLYDSEYYVFLEYDAVMLQKPKPRQEFQGNVFNEDVILYKQKENMNNGKCFIHFPWIFPKDVLTDFVNKVKINKSDSRYQDVWLAEKMFELDFKIYNLMPNHKGEHNLTIEGVSSNAFASPKEIDELTNAIEMGAYAVHGIQTKEAFDIVIKSRNSFLNGSKTNNLGLSKQINELKNNLEDQLKRYTLLENILVDKESQINELQSQIKEFQVVVADLDYKLKYCNICLEESRNFQANVI